MTRAAAPASRAHARRTALMLSSCGLALALAAMPGPASAQVANPDKGFQAPIPTIEAGDAFVSPGPTGGKSTTIDIRAPRTVLTWRPDDPATSGTIDFLPEGYKAHFGSFSETDYTVLNRILPGGTATIGLNGTITSSVYDGGEGQNPGGNVWFYTPNGFVIGRNATISVGGLILTTNDISYSVDQQTGNVSFLNGSGAIAFRGPAGSTGSIVNDGTLIGSSYIALVAPRVVQKNLVSSDGPIAYVAAEEADLTINAGNFDIAIGQGTTDANGIDHSGITTGTVSSFDPKTISFVAVAKNTAMTMLLAGDMGYVAAESATTDGSAIELRAGATGPNGEGKISIGTAYFGNAITANASDHITVAPTSPGPSQEGISSTIFTANATLSGDKSVTLRAAAGTSIAAYSSLSLLSANDTAGGTITISALGGGLGTAGSISVENTLSASANHSGGTTDDGKTGLDGQGGSVALLADGGNIGAQSVYLYAAGYGGTGTETGGEGRGGTVDLRAGLGGSISTAFASIQATGDGGGSFDFSQQIANGGQGGVGRGGTISIADSSGDAATDSLGGELSLGTLFANASAVGGNSGSFGAGRGGDAFGGTIKLAFDRHDQSMEAIYASARAADGDAAVDPLGGTIEMVVGGGSAVNLGTLSLDTSALASVNGPVGAYGTGGAIELTVKDGAALTVFGETRLDSSADTASFFSGSAPARTPDLTGGNVTLTVNDATFSTQDLSVDVTARNVGAEANAGFARGGTVLVEAVNGGSITTVPSDGFGGTFVIDAEASGTHGLFANPATGGSITLSARDGGTIEALDNSIALYAGAYARDGGRETESESLTGNGVIAQGGTIAVDALGGNILSGVFADVTGRGGDADGNAGAGMGGTIAARILGGTIRGSLLAQAYGIGGTSLLDGSGGEGRGGRLTFASDADATFDAFGLTFNGYGIGGEALAGAGGDGYGGSAQIDILGGKHAWFDAYLDGSASGASSAGTGSTAGSAYGSPAGLIFHLGEGASLSAPSVSLNARAWAGANGGSSEAIGGIARVLVDGGAGLSVQGLGLDASAALSFEERSPSSIDTTPTARGGSTSILADGGTISTSRIDAIANGETGGAMLAAGTATGGTAVVGAANGGAIEVIPSSEGGGVEIQALGLGGEGPSAAHAIGGTATLYTAGGRFESPLGLVIAAGAEGGDFSGTFNESGIASNGFNATGGTASVEMRTGTGDGVITVPSVLVTARGLADTVSSVEGSGGVGTGGTPRLAVASGTLDTGAITLVADGRGGLASERPGGGSAYASGTGVGGTAELRMAGGTIKTSEIELVAEGSGGDGVGGTSGATPSLAGAGAGGTAALFASGGTLANTGGVTLEARGYGGSGAFNAGSGSGGAGASGTGGTARFVAAPGGTSSLGIAGPVLLFADGSGGSGGASTSGVRGDGGDGVGGVARVALAEIPFDFGTVTLNASGLAGFGPGGDGTGGLAEFALADTSSAAVGPRKIGSLSLQASGAAGTGGSSIGGATSFTAQAGNPASGLAIGGNLRLIASGLTGLSGNGFTGAISGAPVTVGGSVQIATPRDAVLTIGTGGALQATGNFIANVGRSFTSTGLITTAANASIIAPDGISMTDLTASGTTMLRAINGPVIVSRDLRSGGLVTVLGRSINLVSLGALSFADADATAGDLSIRTTGNLDLVTVDATGAVSLTSSSGSIRNTGAVNGVGISYTAGGNVVSDVALASGGALSVDAGGTFVAPSVTAAGNVSLSADLGMALSSVVSGGTTVLQADAGALSVDSLTSPGSVTALARSVAISSPGALAFTSAQATAGELSLTAAGNLSLATGSATGAATLTSTGGAVIGTGPLTAGTATISAANGIALGTLTSGGTTALTSSNGSVAVANLNSAGAVTARGGAVDIASTGALSFTDLDATAGNVAVRTAGDLAVNTVDATGSVSLVSSDGALSISGALNGTGITLASKANLQLTGPLATGGAINLASTGGSVSSTAAVTAGGSLNVAGQAGITLGSASSGGATSLSANAGTITVGNLSSAGAVTATGRAIDIASAGALNFTDARATSGDLRLATGGNLALAQAGASGALALSSSGAISATGPLTAGGNASLAATNGIAAAALTSGGTTNLASTSGTIAVSNLNSAGAITATGRSIDIGSTGALAFADLDASAGNVAVQAAGNLSVNTVDAAGSVSLASTSGALQSSGGINGASVVLGSQASMQLAGPVTSAGAMSLASTAGSVSATSPLAAGTTLSVAGQTGIALGTASSGATSSLSAPAGPVTVANLGSAGAVTAVGRSVEIGSAGPLSFADAQATAGDLRLSTGGNLTLAQAKASGAASLTSSAGGVLATGPVAGGSVIASGHTGVTFGSLTSGGSTALTSANGAVNVANLASGGAVSSAARAIDLRSPASMTVASAQASAGALNLQAGQNLTVGVASASGAATFAAGNDLRTTGLVSAATLSLAGENITADGQLRASAALAIDARQALTVNALASGNTVSVAASDIAIGSSGRIGQRGITKSVAITTQDGAKAMNLGGTGKAGEFSLDKAEASRLFADEQIVITQRAGSTTPGEVRIGELAMGFGTATAIGANIGAGGLLKVDALGRVEVNGPVSLATVSAGDRFSIDPTRIDVIAGEGSIAMRDASGGLLGTLELQAGTIAVADRATLAAIGAASDFAAINRLLDTPAVGAPQGVLHAGTIKFLTGDALFIQNTGASTALDARRGFNANNIVITTSSTNPQIAINGVAATSSGTLTGVHTAQAVTINGVPASQLPKGAAVTINGCAIGVRCDIASYYFGGRTEDEFEEILSVSNAGEDGPAGEMIQVEPNEPLITPPLVDEPITGVGNDDLWQVRCDPEGERAGCPAKETTE